MPDAPLSTSSLLDAAAVIGLAGPIGILLYTYDGRSPALTVLLAASVAVSVVGWLIWRLRPRARTVSAIVFAAAAIGVMVSGDGPITFGSAWLATLMLARTFRRSAAVGYVGCLCVVAALLHLAGGTPMGHLLAEVASTAILAGFGLVFAIVLTESEHNAARLSAANVELTRRLGHEQDLAITQERARTARELHDGLGHRLTAIGLSLEYIGRIRVLDGERAAEEIEHARRVVGDALTDMRGVVRAMHPVDLTAAPGNRAYAAIADAFRHSGLAVDVDVRLDDDLPLEYSTLLVRFTQEGLTNVVRHSRSNRARVAATSEDRRVTAVIEDFGGREAAAYEEGFGLRGLRERAGVLGGSLSAGPTSAGFRLALELPAHSDEAFT